MTKPIQAEASDRVALVLCSHGVGGGPGVAADHAERLRKAGGFAEVAAACLNGTPALHSVIDATATPDIVVVPFLMAAGRTFTRILPERLSGARRWDAVRISAPVGTHPDIVPLVVALANEAMARRGWPAAETLLVLAAHGTLRDPASAQAARNHAAAIAASGRFAGVEAGFLDEPPSLADLLAAREAAYAVGVGLFADAGPHGAGDASTPFAADQSAEYAGPIGPDPRIAEIVRARAIEALEA
jgi:sirohydrochlorin cobaltochelatase